MNTIFFKHVSIDEQARNHRDLREKEKGGPQRNVQLNSEVEIFLKQSIIFQYSQWLSIRKTGGKA